MRKDIVPKKVISTNQESKGTKVSKTPIAAYQVYTVDHQVLLASTYSNQLFLL
jgi:hypothetical protein